MGRHPGEPGTGQILWKSSTGTNVANLAPGGEIHFVLNYWQDRPTQRQGENNCIQKNQWMCWAGLRSVWLEKIIKKICSFMNLVLQLRRISSCFEPFIRFRIGIIFKRKRILLLQQKLWNLFIFNVMRCWADPVPCLQTCVMRRRLHHIFPLIVWREVS